MEGTQQREQRRGRESRPRGGRNGGQRSERAQRENGAQKEQRNAKPQERRQKFVPIRLHRDIKDIKLNEEQQKEVAELDQQLATLGKFEIPSMDELDEKNKQFKSETDKLDIQLKAIQAKQDAVAKKIEDFTKKHNPHQTETKELQEQIKKIDDVLLPKQDKLNRIREERKAAMQKIRDIKDKSPARSAEDIEYQIEELEYQIETSTLSNTQLKNKLAAIESLKKSRGQFGDFTELKVKADHLREEERTLAEEVNKLRDEKFKLRTKRNEFYSENKGVKEEVDKLWEEKKSFYDDIKKVREAINAKYDEKRSFNNEFMANRRELFSKRRQQDELNHQRLQIYQDAERHMELIESAQTKVMEIKERKNPNEEKISAARALIGFLEGKLALHEDFTPAKPVEHEVVETEASKLIGSVRKQSKKDRKRQKREEKPKDEKPKAKKISYSLDAIQQFATVGVTQPVTFEEIPAVIEALKSKVTEWTESFVKIVLNFNVQADGSIKSEIKLA